jgi:hypothetical protein
MLGLVEVDLDGPAPALTAVPLRTSQATHPGGSV